MRPKRASAKSIVAVIPYFGWARQDRKDKPRVSIGAKLVADLLSVAGIDRLITMDLDVTILEPFTVLDVPALSFQLFNKTIDQNSRIYIMMSFLKAVNPKTNCSICDIRLSDNLLTRYILSP